jgi:hypothetical protein
MPLTKQQIAIKCYYEGRRKQNRQPRDRMVLDGKMKLTPRRREILFHVACTDDIWWNLAPDWNARFHRDWKSKRFEPVLGSTTIVSIVKYLMQRKLTRYSREGLVGMGTSGRRYDKPPILLITPKGMDALLECVEFRTGITL